MSEDRRLSIIPIASGNGRLPGEDALGELGDGGTVIGLGAVRGNVSVMVISEER